MSPPKQTPTVPAPRQGPMRCSLYMALICTVCPCCLRGAGPSLGLGGLHVGADARCIIYCAQCSWWHSHPLALRAPAPHIRTLKYPNTATATVSQGPCPGRAAGLCIHAEMARALRRSGQAPNPRAQPCNGHEQSAACMSRACARVHGPLECAAHICGMANSGQGKRGECGASM